MLTWLSYVVWLPLVIALLTGLYALPGMLRVRRRANEIRLLSSGVTPVHGRDRRLSGLGFRCHRSGTFLVRVHEGAPLQLGRRLESGRTGIGVEPFDQHYHLKCDDPRVIAWLVSDGEARELIATLRKRSSRRSVMLSGEQLILKADLQPDSIGMLRTTVLQLRELTSRIPPLGRGHSESLPSDRAIDRIRLLSRILPLAALTAALYVFLFDTIDSGFPQHASPWTVLGLGALGGLPLAWLMHIWVGHGLKGSSREPAPRTETYLRVFLPILALAAMTAQQVNLKLPGSAFKSEIVTVLYSSTDTIEPQRSRRARVKLDAFGHGVIPARTWSVGYGWATQARSAMPLGGKRLRVQWRYGWLGQPLIAHPPAILRDESP